MGETSPEEIVHMPLPVDAPPPYFTGMMVNDTTGEIYPLVFKVAYADAGLQKVGDDPEFMIEGEWDAEAFYCPNGPIPEPRPKLLEDSYAAQANAVDEVVLPVPPGTIVLLAGKRSTVDDGQVVLTSSITKVAVLDVRPPYPAQRQTVEVTFS